MHNTLQALSFIKAPVILMQMVTLLYMANGFMKQDLHMVEYFAGQMEVSCHKHSVAPGVYVHYICPCGIMCSHCR